MQIETIRRCGVRPTLGQHVGESRVDPDGPAHGRALAAVGDVQVSGEMRAR